MVGSYAEGTVTQNGKTTGLWFMGIANYAAVLTTITLKAALVTEYACPSRLNKPLIIHFLVSGFRLLLSAFLARSSFSSQFSRFTLL